MTNIKKVLLTFLASAFVALQLVSMPVGAQQGSGLQVSPPRAELTIERGQASSFDVTLTNRADQPVIAKYVINDFESDGVSGDPKIIVDDSVVSDNSIRDFLVDLEDVNLGPNEKKTFRITAQIPEATTPGSYYGIVRYQAVPLDAEGEESDTTQFSLNASLGVIVLIDVPGNVTQGAEVTAVEAQSQDLNEEGQPTGDVSGGSFFMSAPNQIAVSVRNTGGSFVKPFGKVIVKNMFGSTAAEYELNSPQESDGPAVRGNILPDSSRTFTDQIDIGGFGRYTIEANVSYIQGGEVITSTVSFWVLPIWFIILLLVLLAGIVFGGVTAYRRFLG
ncbi:MAG: hypothetical protein AAF413_01145 [Patescibacteria group bacterium]